MVAFAVDEDEGLVGREATECSRSDEGLAVCGGEALHVERSRSCASTLLRSPETLDRTRASGSTSTVPGYRIACDHAPGSGNDNVVTASDIRRRLADSRLGLGWVRLRQYSRSQQSVLAPQRRLR